MVDTKNIIRLALSGILLLAIVYYVIASWYVSNTKERNAEQVANHALIIAHDLWSLNHSGMQAYLDLVAATNHFKTLEVLAGKNDLFLKISGPEPPPMDATLLHLGLIRSAKISYPVLYKEQEIGVLQGEQYNRIVYPLFYIFLLLLFSILTLVFISYLIFNRRLLEIQVQERTQKFLDLVGLLPEMVLETDAEGYITFANEKAQKCFGIKELEQQKHSCSDFIRFANGEAADIGTFAQAPRPELDRKEYRAKDFRGTLFPVLVRTAPILIDDECVGARMIIIDITERQAMEEQLTRDQKMKSIGIMAGGVAHDLNNILSGIINYPELLLHQLPKNSPLVEIIEPMRDAGLRAAAVVADLLTVARGVAASRETANLNEIILDYTYSPEFEKLASLYPGITFNRKFDPELPTISCSVIHVRKSIMNLVNNGSEAIDSTGEVTISTRSVVVNSPITTVHGIISPGDYATLTVEDSGKGIAPAELSQVLEPFFSKKELGRSGTGLGLTVVWNTVQDHDGGIVINSTEQGTSFTLYFPVTGVQEQETVSKFSAEDLSGDGQSILIVDDEFHQRDIATRLLASLGYLVESVASGEAAVKHLHHHNVDLVILDMIMESGMNGLETYKEIKKISPSQRAVIISGFSESEDVKNTIQLGAGGLVNKPYTKEQLARAVLEELRRPI